MKINIFKSKEEKAEQAAEVEDKSEEGKNMDGFDKFLSFGVIVMILAFFYMGAIDTTYHLNRTEIFKESVSNAMNNVSIAGTDAIMKYYEVGSERPQFWTWVFWGSIILSMLWFSGDVIKRWINIIKNLIKGEQKPINSIEKKQKGVLIR